MRRRPLDLVCLALLRLCALVAVACLCLLLGFLLREGLPALSWRFVVEMPREGMTAGGILPALVGTLLLTVGAMLVALPLGVLSAVYLTEYAPQGAVVRLVRLGMNNLAGVPSVVFGLFGMALFVELLGLRLSLLSGALTLGLLILPLVIRASEEALLAVPVSLREASLALGATRWQTVRRVVLPAALPGILTGSILALGRAAGETAPIIFTAACFSTPHLPRSPLDPVMALPYHLYVMATESTAFLQTRPQQFATALVLLALVLGLDLVAVLLRARARRRAGA